MRRRIVGVLASAITALGAVAVAPDAPAVKPGGPAVTTGAVAFAGSGLTAGANGAHYLPAATRKRPGGARLRNHRDRHSKGGVRRKRGLHRHAMRARGSRIQGVTAAPLGASPIGGLPGLSGAAPTAGPPGPIGTDPFSGRLQVVEREFSLELSRPTVAAGEVIVESVNFGEDPHNIYLQYQGADDPPLIFATLGPGEIESKRLVLRPGTYRVWCELPGHDSLGMNATLRVL